MHYEGSVLHVRHLEDLFLEAMDDDLGHKLSTEVIEGMCHLANQFENLELEMIRNKQKITDRLEEARDLVQQAHSIQP
ncbi:hypothetical protein NHP190003_14720 [Helicobacter sp. NHP19-003]|uniref:Uncharacterized protein n=1 Tax=Helicobacter gastrocanis TaxID=2849641 RepID=A0ABN6I9F9_9HELI|nr:hypothetical protein [Helicobacter sp. NHP19-003]BCZ18190.1 hypothetical protein NHP190003_14720 [Helicobacter sp. NHP19-003]